MEDAFMASKPEPTKSIDSPKIDETLQITLKLETEVDQISSTKALKVDPSEMTIEETLRLKSDERKSKLKAFNYQFSTNAARLDDLEKEPAYKRLGIELNQNADNKISNTTLSLDSNNQNQLRTGNSYLHNNVD
jgi:cell division protein FtsZ